MGVRAFRMVGEVEVSNLDFSPARRKHMVRQAARFEVGGQFLGVHNPRAISLHLAVSAREREEEFAQLLKILDQEKDAPDEYAFPGATMLPEVRAQYRDRHHRTAHACEEPFVLAKLCTPFIEGERFLDLMHERGEHDSLDPQDNDGRDVTDRVKNAFRDVILGVVDVAVISSKDPIEPGSDPC